MIEQHPDSFFRDLIYDHEAPSTGLASFEQVMERRNKKKRRFFFWWNFKTAAVVTGLLMVGGGAWAWMHISAPTNIPVNYGSKSAVAKLKDASSSEGNHSQYDGNQSLTYNHLGSQRRNSAKLQRLNNQLLEDHHLNFQRLLAQPREKSEVSEINAVESVRESVNSEGSTEKNSTIAIISEVLNARKLGINPNQYTDPSMNWLNYEFDIPEHDFKLKLGPSKWYGEFSAITGSNNTINFDEAAPMSILGTQYMAQYQGLILKDMENGSMFGAGIQYSEWVGNGQWRKYTDVTVAVYDTIVMPIKIKGMPTRYVVLADTAYVTSTNTSSGNIEYRIDKLSFPLAYRFITSIGKTPVRLAMHLAPGFTTMSKGFYFTNTDFYAMETNKRFTMDAHLSLGPVIPINRSWTFVIEPSIMYQSFVTPDRGVNGKFFTGLGVAILRRF